MRSFLAPLHAPDQAKRQKETTTCPMTGQVADDSKEPTHPQHMEPSDRIHVSLRAIRCLDIRPYHTCQDSLPTCLPTCVVGCSTSAQPHSIRALRLEPRRCRRARPVRCICSFLAQKSFPRQATSPKKPRGSQAPPPEARNPPACPERYLLWSLTIGVQYHGDFVATLWPPRELFAEYTETIDTRMLRYFSTLPQQGMVSIRKDWLPETNKAEPPISSLTPLVTLAGRRIANPYRHRRRNVRDGHRYADEDLYHQVAAAGVLDGDTQ